MSGQVPGNVREMSRTFPNNVRSISGKHPVNLTEMSRAFPHNLRILFGTCPGRAERPQDLQPAGAPRVHPGGPKKGLIPGPGNVAENSRKFPGNFPEISRKCPGNFPEISRKIPGKYLEHSGKCAASVASPGWFRWSPKKGLIGNNKN